MCACPLFLAQLDRLLDTENPCVTLQTMVKAARGIGKKLEVRLGRWEMGDLPLVLGSVGEKV